MEPKIRAVSKYPPPWPLNEFPAKFANSIGREIIAHLAVDHTGDIKGETWEQMFAVSLGANWKPSNVGLDDIVLGDCAWGAKTLKNNNPFEAPVIRLISGRNSPDFSYSQRPTDPALLGEMALGIWNQRLTALQKNYRHTRSVILIKPDTIEKEWLDFAIYEFDMEQFNPKEYEWRSNTKNNLEGYSLATKEHCFTWQPHGSQFTVLHKIHGNRLKLQVKKPEQVKTDVILRTVKFDDSWVRVLPSK